MHENFSNQVIAVWESMLGRHTGKIWCRPGMSYNIITEIGYGENMTNKQSNIAINPFIPNMAASCRLASTGIWSINPFGILQSTETFKNNMVCKLVDLYRLWIPCNLTKEIHGLAYLHIV
jgi:hypothetical protein